VSGVAYDKNQVKVTVQGVPDKPGVAAKIFNTIADNNIVVDMIIQNIGEGGLTDMSFTVPKTDAKKTLEIMKKVVAEIGAKDVNLKEDIAKISIVGVGMRSHSGVAAQMFSSLAKEGINIMMISTSEIKISCVIEAKYAELAVRVLHETFGLDKAA
jgi:aspartate kinase